MAIARVVSEVNVCIVVIGKEWLNIRDSLGNRRLDNPDDTVRKEIATAIQHGAKIFPVLVGGASMPDRHELPPDLQPLCEWQAVEITEQNWDDCYRTLLRGVEEALGVEHLQQSWDGGRKSSKTPMIVALSALGILAVIGIALAIARSPRTVAPDDRTKTIAPATDTNQTQPPPSERQPAKNSSQPTTDTSTDADVTPEPAPVAPPPEAAAAGPVTGTWQAVVTVLGQQYNESFELYSDYSFRATLRGVATAVGTWQQAPNGMLEFVRSTNLAANAVKFSCRFEPNGQGAEAYSGSCVDQFQQTGTISMNRVSSNVEAVPLIPRVNTSALSLGQRAVFAQYLATQRCTCPCGLNLFMCLRKDQTCPYSPNLAQTALVSFIAMTHS